MRSLYISLPLLALALLVASLTFREPVSAATSGINGYAWSDTIGWIDLNCANAGTCGSNNFGLSVASDGTISGYAWSDNVGWVSAQSSDVSGCPSSPCTPKIVSGAMQGWMKALSAAGDGWDGWISLSGSGYGPRLSSGSFSGYAWGSDVVGWVDWSLATSDYTPCTDHYYCSANDLRHEDANCADTKIQTCSYQCAAGACIVPPPPSFTTSGSLTGHLQATPQILPRGLTAVLYWNVDNVVSCTVTGSNGDSWSTTSSGAAGVHTSPILQQTIYTLTCNALAGASPATVTEDATVNIIPIFQEL